MKRILVLFLFAAMLAGCAAAKKTRLEAARERHDRGSAHYKAGDYDLAIAEFEEAIRLDPGNAEYHNDRAATYLLGKGDLDRAIAGLTQTIRVDPGYALAYNNRGFAYFKKSDYDRAIADYDQAIRLDSNFAGAYMNRGAAYFDQGDSDRAIADFTQAIRLDSNLVSAYNRRGVAYLDEDELESAIADFTQVIRLNPDNATAYVNRCNAYRAYNEYDSAIADCKRATALEPYSARARAYFDLGSAYYENSDYRRAITSFSQAIRLAQDDSLASMADQDREFAYFRLNGKYYKWDGTIEELTQAIRLNPNDACAHHNRGNAYIEKGYFYDAIDDYEAALRIDPNHKNHELSKQGLENAKRRLLSESSDENATGKTEADNEEDDDEDDDFDASEEAVIPESGAVPSVYDFTDARDGRKYRTVKIGKRVWMAENLNYEIDSSWCYKNKEDNCKKYGRLYDWNTAMKACPAGWRLPDTADWENLARAAGGKWRRGGEDYYWHGAGGRLKSRTGWRSDCYYEAVDLGFLALPGGYRMSYAEFDRIGYEGHWWAAAEYLYDDVSASNWSMSTFSNGLSGWYSEKSSGSSVRCVLAAAEFDTAAVVRRAALPADTKWYSGNPAAKTFTISTARELAGLAQIVNGTWGGKPARDDFKGKTVKLSKNIDLSQYDNWIPIGDYAVDSQNVFAGTFDGGGRVISRLAINAPEAFEPDGGHGPADSRDDECGSEGRLGYQGLFGYIRGGSVENLGLDSVKIIGGSHVGGIAGGIAGRSRIVNSYSGGEVRGYKSVGGAAGSVSDNSAVINSSSGGHVSSCHFVGGVAGGVHKNSRVAGSFSDATVLSFDEEVFSGGVAGIVSDSSMVTGSYFTGNVTSIFYVYTGGVAGNVMDNSKVVNCAALNRRIEGNGWLGRIAGYNDSTSTLSNNIASAEMKNSRGNRYDWSDKDADGQNGADITAAQIKADGTLGGRFKKADGWTTENGKLPGLRGKAVELPEHLRD